MSDELDGQWLAELLPFDYPARPLVDRKVEVRIKASAFERNVQVSGTMTVPLVFSCVRCLEEWTAQLPLSFSHVFCPDAREKGTVRDLELTSEDLEVLPYQGEEIDLNPRFREEILLNLDLSPICRKDCKGLCPNCGKNRNIEGCGCQVDELDPRMAPLREIRIK